MQETSTGLIHPNRKNENAQKETQNTGRFGVRIPDYKDMIELLKISSSTSVKKQNTPAAIWTSAAVKLLKFFLKAARDMLFFHLKECHY